MLPDRCHAQCRAFPDIGHRGTLHTMSVIPTAELPETEPLPTGTRPDGRIETCRDPVFILTASRSGSTLLRFILDTHPDFACPPETMIANACISLLRSWDILENAGSGQHRLVTGPAQLPDVALDVVRETVDRVYGHYLDRRGKPRWCDKSLDSIYNAELLAVLYPQARFVCLYRHCMDVVASGVEVCPWGVGRFGFDPYVAQHPGNSIAAIGAYWVDCVKMMLAFELTYPERCHRVRYEDLVTAPEEVTAALLNFLGSAPAPGITAACFQAEHEGDGPGDEKIWFTSKVTSDAIGRGVKVPAGGLPAPLRAEVNELLSKLDYREINKSWNTAVGPADPRLPVTSAPGARGTDTEVPDADTSQTKASAEVRSTPAIADSLVSVADALRERIAASLAAEPDAAVTRWPELAGEAFSLVVAENGRQHEVSRRFSGTPYGALDGAVTEGNDPIVVLIADPRIWQAILSGSANMVTEIRHGRLRCVNRRDTFRVRSDEVHAVAWLLGLVQVPLTRQLATGQFAT